VEASPATFFYRRATILLAIGLAHAYLLWQGDILVSYALCGMIVYPFRRLSDRALIVLGLALMLPSVWFARGESARLANTRNAAPHVEAVQNGETRDASLILAEQWDGSHRSAEIEEDIRTHRQGSYLQLARNRAPSAFAVETKTFGTTFI